MIREAPKRAPWQRWSSAAALAAALAMGVATLFPLTRRREAVAPATSAVQTAVETPPLAIDVRPQPGAVWRKTQLAGQSRLDVDVGEIRASVGKRLPGQSLVIHLPDGEIDDLGTVLSVRVDDGHTTNVQVFEGRVRLRFEGLPSRELGAGESWSAAPRAPAPIPAPSCSVPTPRALPHAARATASRRSQPEDHSESGGPVVEHAPVPVEPQRAREEDQAYLRIVSLLSTQRVSEARAAAKDYLLRFPNGFRREEVLGVATSAGKSTVSIDEHSEGPF